ncbi:MAG TPA: DUF4190 domain-containing protein [Phycisphaerales bacterium]|nr:DUF4190 domain-containing protein [Phycisphaerales bacterium]
MRQLQEVEYAMSQSPNPYVSFDTSMFEEQRTSGLAIGALVCSLIFCCPVTTIIGILLGVASLASIGNDPTRKGKGLAITAIILGVVFTVVSGPSLYILGRLGYRYYDFVAHGPNNALTAGFSGDLSKFRSLMDEEGAAATDSEIQTFFSELQSRYGQYIACKPLKEKGQSPFIQESDGVLKFRYAIQFSNESVNAEFELLNTKRNPTTLSDAFYNRVVSIHVIDQVRGDLYFPASAATTSRSGAASKPAQTQSEPSGTAGSNADEE